MLTAELKGQFLRLYQMALTDGDFSPAEWKMLYQFAEERNIPREDLDKTLIETTGVIEVPQSVEKKIEYLFDLCRMIWADGKVTEDELATLRKYCKKFGFKDENIEELSDYLLECAEKGVSREEVLSELN